MNWMRRELLLAGIFLLLSAASCRDRDEAREVEYRDMREELFEMNRQKSKAESDRIDSYIRAQGWQVTTTGTGLRYFIYEHGSGDTAKAGLLASIHYSVHLLDGTLCYASLDGEPREFLIGQDDVESGLHEGILHMREGDKAKMILPSHLAHGFTGDQQKIPMDATIVYDVELVSLR